MLNKKQLKTILTQNGIIPEKEFDNLSCEAKAQGIYLENYLIDKKIIAPEALYQNIAAFFNLPFINLKEKEINKKILTIVPEPIAALHQIIPFESDEREIKIATTNPGDMEIFEFIKKKTDREIKIYVTTPENIKNKLNQYHEDLKSELTRLEDERQFSSQGTDKQNVDLKKIAANLPVVKTVNNILEYAIQQNASDIHIEPEEKDLIVRYRVDGMLHDITTLPKNSQPGIIARIKILANLKVDEHRIPQDGRFKISNNQYTVSFRVSIIPTFDGENIVMRLLDEKAQILTLEQLGLQPKSLEIAKKNIKKPHGMILVTGPTGSGKTTTLYTILNMLNTPTVNICSIEDPIEYRVPRVNQSQVNAKIGFTFAIGLRAMLRQDPDIIMVGEIRDKETAEIAVHSALTGHLVLSTLHTNDAIGSLLRLNDLGIPHFLITDTVNLIVAQRLVRRICPNCIQSYNLDKNAISDLEKKLNINNILATLKKEKIISESKDGIKSILFYHGKGCTKCNNTGYKGRIGIYETLEMTDELKDLIIKKASVSEIKSQAEKQDMITMLEDGFIKAKNGITTIEEILRVAKE
ncbi:MAG: GspE/PulE family protein [Patescibacteria group bacterium]|nr:GspE/PulE family protein [Patescibacteria group bacterium]MDD4611259.1 GspE/PulE family protein [Patescibacteria group bacterium]